MAALSFISGVEGIVKKLSRGLSANKVGQNPEKLFSVGYLMLTVIRIPYKNLN